MRLQKLKAENGSLREGLASLKTDNINLGRSLNNREILFNSMPAGIILIQQGKILEMNEVLLEQLGYRAEEVLDHDFLDFVHHDLKRYVSGIHNVWDSGKMVPDQYDVRLVKQNGETIYCDAKVKRIRFKSRTTFLLILTRLEKRKEMERKSLHSTKMEALITMASGLNHAFRDYLDTLLKNIKDLRTVSSGDNNGIEKAIKEIENRAYMALSITRELEAFARKENDKQDMTSLDINDQVKEAVTSTIQTWKDGPESKGLKIGLKTYLRSSSPIEGNPKEIKGALSHMITNAVEAMPCGGEIDITTEENAGYAHLYIQDSGIGIPGQFKERIFDPFFTTKGDDSMGLGLSLSYAVFKRHKGDIEITSQEGQGTIFHIKLPLTSQEERPKPDRKRIKGAQILIIQEDDVARELLSHLLTSKGCNVNTANNSLEGLGELKRKKFDLVVAETETPHLGGNSFVKKSRKINPELSIVVIKGAPEGDPLGANDEPDADLMIMKPLDVNKVVKQILKLLMFRR
ncbi:ATP-binding protein [Thermodesulfobacteriota bacterium]